MGCIHSVGLFFWRSRWDVLIVSVCSFGGHDGRHLRIAVFFIIIIIIIIITMSTTYNSRLFP